MVGVLRTRAELGRALTAATLLGGADGGPGRRGLVMTMGALHAGHISLVERARNECDVVIVSIFVNPLQFGAGEDLDKYPRGLEADLALLDAAGADLVYVPDASEVYPDGDPVVRVSAGALGERFEGAIRPGHFDGVLTVVLKVFHRVRPDVAYFGQKDAQQLALIQRMVADLDVPVQIEAVPIVRDGDGLALSSRNVYLSESERSRALGLSRAMAASESAAANGGVACDVLAAASANLSGLNVDYLELVNPATLTPVDDSHTGPALMLAAARLGTTRLIDNAPLEISGPNLKAQQ